MLSTCEPVFAVQPALGSPLQGSHGHSGPWPVARLAGWQEHMEDSERLRELSWVQAGEENMLLPTSATSEELVKMEPDTSQICLITG